MNQNDSRALFLVLFDLLQTEHGPASLKQALAENNLDVNDMLEMGEALMDDAGIDPDARAGYGVSWWQSCDKLRDSVEDDPTEQEPS